MFSTFRSDRSEHAWATGESRNAATAVRQTALICDNDLTHTLRALDLCPRTHSFLHQVPRLSDSSDRARHSSSPGSGGRCADPANAPPVDCGPEATRHSDRLSCGSVQDHQTSSCSSCPSTTTTLDDLSTGGIGLTVHTATALGDALIVVSHRAWRGSWCR